MTTNEVVFRRCTFQLYDVILQGKPIAQIRHAKCERKHSGIWTKKEMKCSMFGYIVSIWSFFPFKHLWNRKHFACFAKQERKPELTRDYLEIQVVCEWIHLLWARLQNFHDCFEKFNFENKANCKVFFFFLKVILFNSSNNISQFVYQIENNEIIVVILKSFYTKQIFFYYVERRISANHSTQFLHTGMIMHER